MGRKRPKAGSKQKKKEQDDQYSLQDRSLGRNITKTSYSVEHLLEKAENCADQFEFDLAEKFCRRALEQDQNSLDVLDALGPILLENGKMEDAKEAISIDSTAKYSRYMYLGQLSTGKEAVANFRAGIEIMMKFVQQQPMEETPSPKDISSAYCSIAEIFMTDCCMEEDAESQCKEALDSALKLDAENPEALQILASYHLSKDNKQEALEAIEMSISFWLPWLRDLQKPEGAACDIVEPCPISYQHRLTSAKILIEVEKYDDAGKILELLLDEEDTIVEVWYMLGWLNHLQGELYYGNSRFYLTKALEVAKKNKFNDTEVLQHIQELLQTLGPAQDEDEDDAGDVKAADELEDDWNTSEDDDDVDKEMNNDTSEVDAVSRTLEQMDC